MCRSSRSKRTRPDQTRQHRYPKAAAATLFFLSPNCWTRYFSGRRTILRCGTTTRYYLHTERESTHSSLLPKKERKKGGIVCSRESRGHLSDVISRWAEMMATPPDDEERNPAVAVVDGIKIEPTVLCTYTSSIYPGGIFYYIFYYTLVNKNAFCTEWVTKNYCAF